MGCVCHERAPLATDSLRRAFGVRWAVRFMPAQLMELKGHESIETTLRNYVGANAQRTNDAIWQAYRREQERLPCTFSDFSPDPAPPGLPKPPSANRRSVLEITEPNRSRPGVIRTHDQGIMSGDEPEE